MKGIVFTKFLDMVEEEYGLEVLDEVLYSIPLKSNGVYVSTGTYDHQELIQIVASLSKIKHLSTSTLLKKFGVYMFSIFSRDYANLLLNFKSSFDFLESLDTYVHVEVGKIHPEAELPMITFERMNNEVITILYESQRNLAFFAEGLILGCGIHFNEALDVFKSEDLSQGLTTKVKFHIRKG